MTWDPDLGPAASLGTPNAKHPGPKGPGCRWCSVFQSGAKGGRTPDL